MKKFIAGIAVALVCAVLVPAQAGIEFTSEQVDFGEVDSGKIVDLEFEFTNTGNDILEIKNITSTCGCTVTSLEKKTFKPGEKGIIPVKFYSRGYQGRVVKTLTVSTNDPKKAYVRLRLTGIVTMKNYAGIEVAPNRLHFEKVPLGGEAEQTFEIRNPGSLPLRIIEVIHGPEVSPRFDGKSVGPGESLSVTLHLKGMAAGPFVTYLKIRSNAFRQSLAVVKVDADIAETGAPEVVASD
ncbi:MAG TPA: DUF1573 domain-containing protein [Candidatus Aminicenantes bacterium]|nr:DUF1573 domain-containing protein [Candidatus Aminicenantes bacterium]